MSSVRHSVARASGRFVRVMSMVNALRELAVSGRIWRRLAGGLVVALMFCFPAIAWSGVPPACTALIKLMAQQKPGPVFLASYPTATQVQLKNTAYLYDNALATLALIGCKQPKLAARLGAAILIAQNHDRFWHDGRLRNAYVAGPLTSRPVKLPGWWDAVQQKWVEDRYQVGSDNGNQAFAMLALLACYQAGQGSQYLRGAVRLGAYLAKFFDSHRPAGFTGGTYGEEPRPATDAWKSTEHNADLAAAYQRLAVAGGDARWQRWAQRAAGFVKAMWQPACGCFAAGLALGAHHPDYLVATDAQIFPLLAIEGFAGTYGAKLTKILNLLRHDGGVAYSVAAKGVWTEGTAQLALYRQLSGKGVLARKLMRVLAQDRAPDGSYYATGKGALSTGFGLPSDPSKSRVYFHLPHLGALAWVALAQCGFNPFTLGHHLPRRKISPE